MLHSPGGVIHPVDSDANMEEVGLDVEGVVMHPLEAPPDLIGLGRVGRRRVHKAPSYRDPVGGGGTVSPAPASQRQRQQQRRQQAEGGRPSLARRACRSVG